MRKILKVAIFALLSAICLCFSAVGILFLIPPSVPFDKSKLEKEVNQVIIFDQDGNEVNSLNLSKTIKIDELNKQTINCFIASEDKNFFSHGGLDYKRMASALLTNIKHKSYKQGASTISQQLVKNTFLSNKKTLKRKLDEIKLTLQLEKNYTKNQILELYLNTIYFGQNAYGIEQASNVYFDKSAKDLTLAESAILAGIIKAPEKYNPNNNFELAKQQQAVVLEQVSKLKLENNQNIITAKNQDITLNNNNDYVCDKSYVNQVLAQLCQIKTERPYTFSNCKIYTNFNPTEQEILQKSNPNINTDYQAICLNNKNGFVTAYYSTCGKIARQIASTIKPILVYAPAIENGVVNQYTKLIDEPTNFNGFTPTNFNNAYNGAISVRDCLAKSLNVPTVKLLQTTGTDVCKSFAKTVGLNVTDDNLQIALGCTTNNFYLDELVGAYSTFANFGSYKKPEYITKITDYNDNILYESKNFLTKVFSPSTCTIINDMLKHTVNNGTAKKLRNLPFEVCAKTGTNGNKNGNTDAYAVAYTTDKVFAVWVGNQNSKLMPNSVTGSNQPTASMYQILQNVYKEKRPSNFIDKDVVNLHCDLAEYNKNGNVFLANKNAKPKDYFVGKFSNSNKPTQYVANFEHIKITDFTIDIENDIITIKPNTTLPFNYFITQTFNNQNSVVYCGNGNYKGKLYQNGVYTYKITAFNKEDNTVCEDNFIILPSISFNPTNKIYKKPNNWWIDN